MKRQISFIILLGLILSIIGTDVSANTQGFNDTFYETFGQKKAIQIEENILSFISEQSLSGSLVNTLQNVAKVVLPLERNTKSLAQEDRIKKVIYEDILINGYKELYKNEQKSFSLEKLKEGIEADERQSIENTLISFQKNFIKDSSPNRDTSSFESGSNITGDLNGAFYLNLEPFGNILGKLKLNNILSKIKSSESDTSVNFNLQVTLDKEEKRVSGNLHTINKEEGNYIQIENLTQSGLVDEYSENIFDKINTIFKQGNFIKIPTQTPTYYSEIIRNVQNSGPKWIQNISRDPLFVPYKKIGNTFVLIPSKSICTIEKGIVYSDINECAEKEYEEFLKSYFNLGILVTFTLGDNTNTIRVSSINEKSLSYTEASMKTNGEIQSFSLNVIPNQESFPGEGASLRLINGIISGDFKGDGIIINLRGKMTDTEFSGVFNYFGTDNSFVGGDLLLSNENKKSVISLSFSGENISSSSDSLSGGFSLQSIDETDKIVTLFGKYKESNTEVFSGSINYHFKITPQNDISIEAPKNYVSIDDINSGTEDTGATFP